MFVSNKKNHLYNLNVYRMLSSHTDDHLFIFCICQRKKKSLSVFFIKVMGGQFCLLLTLKGAGHEMEVSKSDCVINKRTCIFLPHTFIDHRNTTIPPSLLHLRDKYEVVSMKKICTDVYILSFPSASFLWCRLDIN